MGNVQKRAGPAPCATTWLCPSTNCALLLLILSLCGAIAAKCKQRDAGLCVARPRFAVYYLFSCGAEISQLYYFVQRG